MEGGGGGGGGTGGRSLTGADDLCLDVGKALVSGRLVFC